MYPIVKLLHNLAVIGSEGTITERSDHYRTNSSLGINHMIMHHTHVHA